MFVCAFWLWATFVILWSSKKLLRSRIPKKVRHDNPSGRSSGRRDRAAAVAAVIALVCILFGWRLRVGARWAASEITRLHPGPNEWSDEVEDDQPIQPPVYLSSEQELSGVLPASLIGLRTVPERMAILRILMERHGRNALPSILAAAVTEKDSSVLAWELRLIGLCRMSGTDHFLAERLGDSRAVVRAAATDALGILRRPAFSLGNGWRTAALDCKPPIALWHLLGPPEAGYGDDRDPEVAIDPSIRPMLESMMLSGSSEGEREAAARALLTWPPSNLHLRVAEWGVWLDAGGVFGIPASIAKEIPPFVHRTGNVLSSFNSYYAPMHNVDKPIIHITSNCALAAQIEVVILDGRPWFAYPLPDDFNLTLESSEIVTSCGALQMNEVMSAAPGSSNGVVSQTTDAIPDCREGYPWLLPHHRLYERGFYNEIWPISSLGLCWQSLIVSPQRLSWMSPPVVPPDPLFKWWEPLRSVPSDWVSNRGETERFLYYDGPTSSALPVVVSLADPERRLVFREIPPPKEIEGQAQRVPPPEFVPVASASKDAAPAREGLYLEVHGGEVRGQHFIVNGNGHVDLAMQLPLAGDAVIQRFREMLIGYGLTPPEAEGLIGAWTPQLFHADGRRFILRMSPADYDRRCPMRVRPAPTEVVRLGLVLSEFGPDASQPAP